MTLLTFLKLGSKYMALSNKKAKSIHISEYLPILLKHKLLIIVCFISGVLIALVILKQTPPGYETTAKLTIKPTTHKNRQEPVDSAFFQEVSLNTHLQLILSTPILEQLLEKLKTNHYQPGAIAQLVGQIKDNFFLLLGKERKVLSPAEQQALRIKNLKNKISVQSIRYTSIVNILVQDSDAESARNIANTLAETYIQYDIGINQQATANSFRFLENQAAEFKDKLEKAEAQFLTYKQKENIFSLTGAQENITAQMNKYNLLLIEAKNKLQELTIRLSELTPLSKRKQPDAVRLRSLLANTVIDNLNEQLINAEVERSKLQKIYRSKHVKIQTIQSTISDLRQQIHHQVIKELANMQQEKKILQSRVQKHQHNLQELEKEVLQVSSKEQKYLMLQRNVETYRKYYDNIMSRIEAVSVNSDIKKTVTDIRFVERAQKPLYPTKPDKRKIFLAGIFGGLFSGIGLALLLEFSDRTVHTEEDIQHYFDLPVIGVIPLTEQTGTWSTNDTVASKNRKVS
ncbi:MAG: hypothetical protein D3918_02410 [Candidatus Electrothrix sp. AX2]|nr:hypothetical protein [Candidatus Electrothrix gigas]